MKQPILLMLVGIPGSGKSTFIETLNIDNLTILSTDFYIEMTASLKQKSYNEIFHETIKEAENCLNDMLQEAIKNNENIIWDQTNIVQKSRKRKLSKIPKHYYKKAIVFDASEDIILKVNNHRKQYGRNLPEHIIKNMQAIFTIPNVDEGFDEIEIIKRNT
jgi:predicted kinase